MTPDEMAHVTVISSAPTLIIYSFIDKNNKPG